MEETDVPASPPDGPLPSTTEYEALVRELDHPIWEVRRDACEELATRGEPRVIPHLLRMLYDSVGAVRFAAAEALGRLGDRSVVPHLLKLFDNPRFGSFGPVIEALANLKAVEAVPHFVTMLRDPDVRIRSLAQNALLAITHQPIHIRPKATPEEREPAIQQWELWWEQNRAAYGL